MGGVESVENKKTVMIILGAIVRSPAIIAPLAHIRLNNSLRFLHPAIPTDIVKVQVSTSVYLI